jgi:hypothetical protein
MIKNERRPPRSTMSRVRRRIHARRHVILITPPSLYEDEALQPTLVEQEEIYALCT